LWFTLVMLVAAIASRSSLADVVFARSRASTMI